MKRCVLLAILLVSLGAESAPASGFGHLRRQGEVRSSYYVPSVVYYYYTPVYYPVRPASVYPTTVYPRVVQPATVFPAPVLPYHPVTVAPFVPPVGQYAVPMSAPPSTTAEPPLSPRPAPGPSTSMRVGESFYEVLPGPAGMSKAGDSCSVVFWNLTGRALTLRISNRDVAVSPGRSVTMDLPSTFAWQVVGREGEATRIPAGRATAEVLIRR